MNNDDDDHNKHQLFDSATASELHDALWGFVHQAVKRVGDWKSTFC